jgi:hypothetical protein
MFLVGTRTEHLRCASLKHYFQITLLCPELRNLPRINFICKELQPISYIHILHTSNASFLKLSIKISVLISRTIPIPWVSFQADFSAVRLVLTFRFWYCFNIVRNNCRQANRLNQQFSWLPTITDLTVTSNN